MYWRELGDNLADAAQHAHMLPADTDDPDDYSSATDDTAESAGVRAETEVGRRHLTTAPAPARSTTG